MAWIVETFNVSTLAPHGDGEMPYIDTAFIFDLDGAHVDSVYQHVLAWQEALDQSGIELSVWRIHRRVGMSGGLFTNMLAREIGWALTSEQMKQLRDLHAGRAPRASPRGWSLIWRLWTGRTRARRRRSRL